MSLPACTAPQQRGCVLSWQSFGDPANPDLILDAVLVDRDLNATPRQMTVAYSNLGHSGTGTAR